MSLCQPREPITFSGGVSCDRINWTLQKRTSPKQSPGSSPGASLLDHYLIENSFYPFVLCRLLTHIQRCQDAIAPDKNNAKSV